MTQAPAIPLLKLSTRDSSRQLNFHQLYIFYAVASYNSFSRAAEAMEITQPAVSIQIQELEKSLGAILFHRRSRGLRVTDVGETVYAYAQQIFGLSNKLLETVVEIQDLRTGHLNLGASGTPGEFVLPTAIGKFRQIYPGIQVEMSVGNNRSVINKILAQELDIGMVGSRPQGNFDELEMTDYVTDEIILVASPNHPVNQMSNLDIQNVVEHGIIVRELGTATRRAADECLEGLGVSPKVAMNLGSNQAIKQAAIAGGGIGVVPRWGVTAEVKSGMLNILDVPRWKCERPLVLVYHKGRHLSPSQRAFLEFLESHPPVVDA